MKNNGLKAVARLGGHLIGGAIVFALFAVCATGVDCLVTFLKQWNASEFTLEMLGFLSHTLMALDIVMVIVCTIISSYRFIREFYMDGE